MLKFGSIIIAVMLLTFGRVTAVDMPPTPIQDAMEVGLTGGGWQAALDEDDFNKNDEFGSVTTGRRSVFKAALFSALLPGAGQYYNGSRRRARYFFAAEAVAWIGYIGLKTYSNWKEDDYIGFAATAANAELDGKSKEFIDLVGFYEDIHQYNSFGRVFDPEREFYPDNAEFHWQWQSTEDQRAFRDLKNSSREADRRADFMIGLAVVNRIISVIDAVRGTAMANRKLTVTSDGHQSDISFSLNPFDSRRLVNLTIYHGF